MGRFVVLSSTQARNRAAAESRMHLLLLQAKELMDEVTSIAREHGFEPSFMGSTFRHRRTEMGRPSDWCSYRLQEPEWYEDDYWISSSADCEIDYSSHGVPDDK